jgi:hypothetical protein
MQLKPFLRLRNERSALKKMAFVDFKSCSIIDAYLLDTNSTS